MESFSQKLTSLINNFHENPVTDTNYLIMKCLVELWESNESIIVPTHKDDEGNISLSTIKPNSGKNKDSPLLHTVKYVDGQEFSKVIYDEEWLVIFTEERFFKKSKGTSLMYGPFDALIQNYTENEDHYLGIIVNPFHDNFTLYLTPRTIGVIKELKESHLFSKRSH